MAEKNNKIELWEGYEKEVNLSLFDDVDFVMDLNNAQKDNDFSKLVTMYFALIGGESTYDDVREHITEEKGYFSVESLAKIIERINAVLPKAGKRAQKHSWKTLS